jgi:hypothetical protein
MRDGTQPWLGMVRERFVLFRRLRTQLGHHKKSAQIFTRTDFLRITGQLPELKPAHMFS